MRWEERGLKGREEGGGGCEGEWESGREGIEKGTEDRDGGWDGF